MSKGSGRRPPAIDAETERANWERTFGPPKCAVCGLPESNIVHRGYYPVIGEFQYNAHGFVRARD